MLFSFRAATREALAALFYLLLVQVVVLYGSSNQCSAQNGTWSETFGDGAWSNSANWSGGTIANGANNTADFTNIDLDAAQTFNNTGFYRNGVDVAPARTIGQMVFGDSNLATPGGWELYLSANSFTSHLTLAGTSPSITVNPLTPVNTGDLGAATPEVIDDVLVNAYLAGTSGFTKLGDGILTLTGAADTTNFVGHKISGVVEIAEGTLRISPTFGYYDFNNLVDPQAQTITAFNIQDGATLHLLGSGVNEVTVPANATANLLGSNGAFANNVTPAGDAANPSVLNVTVENRATDTSETFSAHGNWSDFQTVNISGNTTGVLDNFRLRPNGGGFNTGSFAGSVVNLDNVRVFVRSNSGGNDVSIGELHGTASAEISGGSNPGGVARWLIGGSNTDSEHAGTITSSDGGLDLIKNGTGTLTLSGALTYSPVTTADGGQAGNPDRRGGITTINAGTLALVGTSALPAGVDDTGTTSDLGILYSTVDIQAGGTLDVSGATGTYSTSTLQQVIGTGTIVGNYNHDEGRLAPGDDNVGNSATLARAAGTLTFANDITFNGGEIFYDMSETPAGPNDLLQINGAASLGTGGLVTPNFLGAVPNSGTFTILNAAGGISGSTSGWSVAWPGRGGNLPVSVSGNNLQFTATSTTGANLEWRGDVNADWNVQATANFHNTGIDAADQFFTGDDVTFGDTYDGGNAVGNFTVNIAEDVQPLSMTVDSSNDYTFGGAGRIIGFASLTKRGPSTLTLNSNNTYTGPTNIEAGTVDIGGNAGALGTGEITMSGATIRASNTLTAAMTNSLLNVAAGTSNTIAANGVLSNPATNPLVIPNLAGSGDIRVTTEEPAVVVDGNNVGRLVDLGGVNDQFSGTLTIGPDTNAGASLMGVRFSGAAGAGIPNGTLILEAGTTVSQRQNNVATVAIGALSGPAGSFLSGFAGGGTPQPKTWEIGNLGVSTTFDGAIVDGGAATSLTKVGNGTLTLTGDNTYTGDTTVEDGVLSIDSPYLADTADVYLLSGGLFNLNFSGTDTIDSLFIDGISQVTGTWGSPTSSATNKSSLFSGSGILNITTFVEPTILPGDYNNDGVVNLADYTVWRDNLGAAAGALGPNDTAGGSIGASQYDLWKANFGQTLPAAAQLGSTNVPEPSAVLLAIGALAAGVAWRRKSL